MANAAAGVVSSRKTPDGMHAGVLSSHAPFQCTFADPLRLACELDRRTVDYTKTTLSHSPTLPFSI